MRIYEIYGVLWYYQEFLNHLCKMMSIFQSNVDKLCQLNEKWQDLIDNAVGNENGKMNGVIQVMNFVIQYLLDRFADANDNNNQQIDRPSTIEKNVKLIVVAQNEIDMCLEWVEDSAIKSNSQDSIEASKILHTKWKVARLYFMIFLSYYNRIESKYAGQIDSNRLAMIQDVQALQTCLRQFHERFIYPNQNDYDQDNQHNLVPRNVQFDSKRAILELNRLHASVCGNHDAAIIKGHEINVLHYIIQEYISSFAFPSEIKRDNSNIDIEFVLYLCDVMSNYVRFNQNDGDGGPNAHQFGVHMDASCNKYTMQLIADKVLIVFKNEQLDKQQQQPPVTTRLNKILEKESTSQYSTSALALLIAEETYQHNNAEYLKESNVVGLKKIKDLAIAKELEKVADKSLCHQILATGTAKALITHLIEKWDKITTKSQNVQARYRLVLKRLFDPPKKEIKMPRSLLNLKRGLGYFFSGECCRKYGWYNARKYWIETLDEQQVYLLDRIGLKSMTQDCPKFEEKIDDSWLKDNTFTILWKGDNESEDENKNNQNIFAGAANGGAGGDDGKTPEQIDRDFLKRLDDEIRESIDRNRRISIKAYELEKKHLVGLIGSVFNHSFLIEACFRKSQQNLFNTNKFLDECRRSMNNEMFNKYSASIKETLLFGGSRDDTFKCIWSDDRTKDRIFHKQLLRLAVHLFGVCISINTNPFCKLFNIPYENMNDEFIIGMADNHSAKNGQPGDLLFICKQKHSFFKSQRKIYVETQGKILCTECSSESIEVGKVTSDRNLMFNENHGLNEDDEQWIRRQFVQSYQNDTALLPGYVLSTN